jgi:hypothetical protein
VTRANGNALAHRYPLLEPDERFRLALEAAARGDDVERERLVASCPMVALEASDPFYLDRVEASRELATAAVLELGPIAAQLRLLGVICELVAGALLCGSEAPADEGEAPLLKGFDAAADEQRASGGPSSRPSPPSAGSSSALSRKWCCAPISVRTSIDSASTSSSARSRTRLRRAGGASSTRPTGTAGKPHDPRSQ